MVRRPGQLDKEMGKELALYIENDSTIYRQMTTPLINNYARKKLKGTYNRTQALKGILMLVEAGRRGYIRDFGGLGGTVSMGTKKFTANLLYPMINEQATFEAKRLRKQMMAKKKLKKVRKKK